MREGVDLPSQLVDDDGGNDVPHDIEERFQGILLMQVLWDHSMNLCQGHLQKL